MSTSLSANIILKCEKEMSPTPTEFMQAVWEDRTKITEVMWHEPQRNAMITVICTILEGAKKQ